MTEEIIIYSIASIADELDMHDLFWFCISEMVSIIKDLELDSFEIVIFFKAEYNPGVNDHRRTMILQVLEETSGINNP